MKECTPGQAERLGEALRFRTVTLVSKAPGNEPGYAPFAGFLRFLRDAFPHVAESLRWEQLGELALLLTWESALPAPSALLLYAHFDVVPPGDESAWSHGAFSGDVADGYIWGRGALDDKDCLMGILEAVESLLAAGAAPRSRIYIALGGDEETGGHFGAGQIAQTLHARGVRLSCVFDEGSIISDGVIPFVKRPLALVGLAEKGLANAEVIVKGNPGHSSMPGRGTAAGALGSIVAAIESQGFPARLTPAVVQFLRSVAPHVPRLLGVCIRLARPLWPLFRRLLAASSSMDAILRTTLAVTILRAGEKENVIPNEARAVINMRLLPGDTTLSALEHIARIARRSVRERFSLEVRLLPGAEASDPVPEMAPNRELWEALCRAVMAVEPRAVIAPFLAVVRTDSRRFISIADSIVRLHPIILTSGELRRIHGVDERISMQNYARMIAFYRHLLSE